MGAALGDVQPGRDVAQPDAGVAGDAQQDAGVWVRKTPDSSSSMEYPGHVINYLVFLKFIACFCLQT